MQLRGIHYDTGIDTVSGGLTRPSLPPERAATEIDLVAQQLHANAVRVTGRDSERLLMVGQLAAERGLQVWLSPMLVNGDPPATLKLIRETADGAERLRQQGASVVLVIACELSVFLSGILPGDDVLERFSLLSNPGRLMSEIAASGIDPQAAMAAFLAEAVRMARDRFRGPITYAAGAWEHIDWSQFDFVGLDAYRDAGNRDQFAESLQLPAHQGHELVITEFGCATFRGAQNLGSLAWTIVDRSSSPNQLPGGFPRDETLQAEELTNLLEVFETAPVHGAFVYTLVAPSYPANAADSRLDLDAASYALMRSWPDGHSDPKEAFWAVAQFYDRLQRSN